MINKILEQLEDLEENTLEENVRLCGQLETAIKRTRRFRYAARAVHLLLFSVTALMVLAFFRLDILAETGQLEKVPQLYRAFFLQGALSDTLPESYKKLLIPVVIMLLLPVAADVLFSVLSRSPSLELPESAEKALKTSGVDKKLKFLEKSLDRSIKAMQPSGSFLDSRRPVNWLCILFTGLWLYVLFPLMEHDSTHERMIGYLILAAIWFVLCQAAFRIPSRATALLFPGSKEHTQARMVNSSLTRYQTEVKVDFDAKEEAARLAAMTPAERRQHEWLKQKEEERKQREEEQRRARERKEKEEMEQWMATHRAACRFYSAGICNYYSTPGYTSHCNYYNNPGQCSACLMEKGLIFVNK